MSNDNDKPPAVPSKPNFLKRAGSGGISPPPLPPNKPHSSERISTSGSSSPTKDSKGATPKDLDSSDEIPEVAPRPGRSLGRSSMTVKKRTSVRLVNYDGEASDDTDSDAESDSKSSDAQNATSSFSSGTRQRSNSWRDKLIRGSLDVDADIIIPATENSDDSDEESANDQLFAWGCLLDKMHQTPSPLNIGNIGRDDFNVRQMACGDGHVLLLTEQGHVWSVGKGENGQLGLGDTLGSRPQPKLVMFLTDQAITSVAAGGNQSACLDELGRLYEWGQAAEGKPLVSKPALKLDFQNTRIERVALGRSHCIVSTSNGKVMTWGSNSSGQLGIDYVTDFALAPCLVPIIDRSFEVAASAEGSACVTLKGAVFYWGPSFRAKESDKILKPTKVPFRDPIGVVALGSSHLLALTVGNRPRLLAVGDNSAGQIGASVLAPLTAAGFGEPFHVRLVDQGGSGGGGDDAPSSPVVAPASAVPAAVTRGARSVSVAMEAPSSGGGGLRAAFRKMSSKQNMVKQAVVANAGERPVSTIGGKSEQGLGTPVMQVRDRGARSFSVANASAPKIRSRAEREADQISEQLLMSPGGGNEAGIKAVRAGSRWSVMITTDGQVWCMGEFQFGNQDKIQFSAPTRVQELADVMIADVVGSDSLIVASVGLRNEDDLKFQSFNPPTIKAASLTQLVNWVCTEKTKPDPLFVYTLILTYHCFTTAPLLLAKIRSRYELALSEGSVHSQTQLCNLLVRWLQQRSEDFLEPVARNALDDLIKILVQEPLVRVMQRLLVRLVPDMESKASDAPASGVKLELLDYPPTAVADAMTLGEHALFSKIKLQEFIGQGWSKSDKNERCPGICEAVNSFNKWSVYVAAHIINSSLKETRSKRFAFWVEVHKQLFNLNNLELAVAVGAAFELTPVYKLRNRNMIDVKGSAKKWLSYFADLQSNNKAGYRKLLRKIMAESDPGIPYIGGQLSDLTFLEDGNKSEVEGLINVKKFHMIAKQVRVIDQLQKRKYSGLNPPLELRQFCAELKTLPMSLLDDITEKIINSQDLGGSQTIPRVSGPAAPSESDGVDELSGLTRIQEIVALLEREASCPTSERVAKWNKWRERLERQGEKFLLAWSMSDAWKLTVKNILRDPISEAELRPLRLLGRTFLLQSADPDFAIDMLIALANTEPDEKLIKSIAEMADSMKRMVAVATSELPAVLPHPSDSASFSALLRKFQSDHLNPISRSVVSASEILEAFGKVEEINDALDVPLQQKKTELSILEAEKNAVASRMNLFRDEKTKQIEVSREKVAELSNREQELLAELAKVKQQREELEEQLEKFVVDFEEEETNLSKKMEILDTSMHDESQSIADSENAAVLFAKYCSTAGENLVKAVKSRKELCSNLLQKRCETLLGILNAFKSSPTNSETSALYKEFREKILVPVLADLALDVAGNSGWIHKLKKLKDEVDEKK